MSNTKKIELGKNNYCFVCGEKNPRGLQLRITRDGEKGAKAEFVADQYYGGWTNYLHGGIVSMIFDELLGWISIYVGKDAVTARLQVRYYKPVPLGSRLIFKGFLQREAKGLLEITTFAYLEDGQLAAKGQGRMMIVNRQG